MLPVGAHFAMRGPVVGPRFAKERTNLKMNASLFREFQLLHVSTMGQPWLNDIQVKPHNMMFLRYKKKSSKANAATSSEDVQISIDMAKVELQMKRFESGLMHELANMRSGTADANMLDHITVDAYGTRTPLNMHGQVTMKTPQLMTVTVFDPKVCRMVCA